MLVRTPKDLGAMIRDRRRQLGIDQAALAARIGSSRQWVVAVERGHPRAELALVLRALSSLDLALDIAPRQPVAGDTDIDAILAAARGRRT
jgi:transcriptional regulator with XRE-family HTH domain